MHGCLSHLSLCGPVMDWRPVQGVPRLSLYGRWHRLQPSSETSETYHSVMPSLLIAIGSTSREASAMSVRHFDLVYTLLHLLLLLDSHESL